MKPFSFFYYFSLVASIFFISHAKASSINAQTLNSSVSDHYVMTEDALYSDWPKQSSFYLGLNYNYVNQPLTAISQVSNTNAFTIIDSIQTFDLMFAWRTGSHVGLYASLPIHFVDFPGGVAGFPSGKVTALGDLKLMGKIALSDSTDNVRWALAPELHLPSGNSNDYVSDSSVYGALRIIAESWLGKTVEVAGNIGFGYADGAKVTGQNSLVGFDDRQRLLLGVGSLIKFDERWGANLEFSAAERLPTSQSQSPNDFYAGLRWMPVDSLILTAGGAVGKLGQDGGQNARVMAGLRYSPGNEAPAPTPAPTPKPTPVPTPTPVTAIKATAEKIELLKPILFENNSAKIMTESKWILNEVADMIKRFPKMYGKLYVDGHTNYIGGRAHNQKLSQARAKSVRQYLIDNGIPSSHLIARGFGQDKPIYKLRDPRAIEGNRRVEFNVVK